MEKFSKLDNYTDDELIIIVFLDSENWQKEAVEYAKKLLAKREISDDFARSRLKEIESESIELWNKELERRRVESYGIIELILMPLFWFGMLFKGWSLARDGYVRMRKQRLIGIAVGILFYGFIILEANISYDRINQKEIDEIIQLQISDSIALENIDWSGIYVFVDTIHNQDSKLIWTFIINKNGIDHYATLFISGGKNGDTIKGQCVIKNDELEFYPDSTMQLSIEMQISYYSRLFSLIDNNNELLTYWGKLEPRVNTNYKELGKYFKKTKAADIGS